MKATGSTASLSMPRYFSGSEGSGLCIAIPALFFLHLFQKRAADAADALAEAANVVLSLRKGG
jgi:hypothetical protein